MDPPSALRAAPRPTGKAKKANAKTAVAEPPRRRFWARVDVLVEIDQAVIDEVTTQEWRKHFYDLATTQAVVSHLAFNFVQGRSLSDLEGFAHLTKHRALVLDIEIDDADVEEDVDRGKAACRSR